jgi:hypothetical protein
MIYCQLIVRKDKELTHCNYVGISVIHEIVVFFAQRKPTLIQGASFSNSLARSSHSDMKISKIATVLDRTGIDSADMACWTL